jgi:hypothetical protein
VTLALLIASSLSIASACFKRPDPIIVPIEKDIVAILPSGNYEVKPGLVYDYFRALAQIKLLRIQLDELRKGK